MNIFDKAYTAHINEDYRKAEILYKKLLNTPNDAIKAQVYYNLGLIYIGLKNYKKAISSFDSSNRIKYSGANDWNKSLALLYMGKWHEGVKLYNSRYSDDNSTNNTAVRVTKLPIEFIEDLKTARNKKIIVLNEQGLGDELLFSSQLEKLDNIVEKAIVQVSKETLELFNTIYNFKNIEFSSFESLSIEEVQKWDSYTVLGNVFFSLYKYGDSISKDFNPNLETNKIGICWETNRKSPNFLKRSVDSSYFKNLNFDFKSLQYQKGEELDLENYCPNSILDTWYAMDDLALVITVDTLVTHIAGLKGIPTILLINKHLDWRWIYRDTNDSRYSMFYPNMEIVSINENIGDIIKEYLN